MSVCYYFLNLLRYEKVEMTHLSFQSCCIPCLVNDTALACYIFDFHQPILIIFVDNKFELLGSVQILFLV